MSLKTVMLVCLVMHCVSVTAAPQFSDFPAPVYSGRITTAHLTDAKSRQYATQLQATRYGKVNFSGNHILTAWGCGASCIIAATVDAKTGMVKWLPFTVCCWNHGIKVPLEFRADSRLLIVHGSRDETGSAGDISYYTFDGRKFSEIHH
ncbi:MAG: hypothetical protein M3Y65_22130 [Pseudomonadota bacterium]|nr:hypothetical protein [Pseudomonadota bacterium]